MSDTGGRAGRAVAAMSPEMQATSAEQLSLCNLGASAHRGPEGIAEKTSRPSGNAEAL